MTTEEAIQLIQVRPPDAPLVIRYYENIYVLVGPRESSTGPASSQIHERH